jgi:hypothetical protein
MIARNSIRGVIHGKTLELASDPGFDPGQEVQVQIRAVVQSKCGEGLRRSAGAFAVDWTPEDDAVLNQLRRDRAASAEEESS